MAILRNTSSALSKYCTINKNEEYYIVESVAHSLLTNITVSMVLHTTRLSVNVLYVSQLKRRHSLKSDELTVYSTHTSKYKEGILTLLKPRFYCRIYVHISSYGGLKRDPRTVIHVHSKCYQYVCT